MTPVWRATLSVSNDLEMCRICIRVSFHNLSTRVCWNRRDRERERKSNAQAKKKMAIFITFEIDIGMLCELNFCIFLCLSWVAYNNIYAIHIYIFMFGSGNMYWLVCIVSLRVCYEQDFSQCMHATAVGLLSDGSGRWKENKKRSKISTLIPCRPTALA